uniref:Uncharacterized protein n=1 Tax=Candidatus Methanogaster sp. ANME-2c ERB4 TaxID=2759911 RepID=A0A7G9YA58_9EURY|nr:hypothetical protein GGFKAAOC_00004 [Methanosarcinales archaeon ANME-2c ERB4]
MIIIVDADFINLRRCCLKSVYFLGMHIRLMLPPMVVSVIDRCSNLRFVDAATRF